MRQYQGEGLSAVGQVVISEDPGAFLGQLSTMSAFNDLQDQLFTEYSTELKALEIRRQATAKRAAEVAATEKALRQEKAAVDSKLAEAKELLADLKAEERDAGSSRRSSTTRIPSGRAGLRPRRGRGRTRAGPGRRRLRLRRRRAERLRLLRSDHDLLGRGRRRPAALLGRAVRLRPAHRGQRPAAR